MSPTFRSHQMCQHTELMRLFQTHLMRIQKSPPIKFFTHIIFFFKTNPINQHYLFRNFRLTTNWSSIIVTASVPISLTLILEEYMRKWGWTNPLLILINYSHVIRSTCTVTTADFKIYGKIYPRNSSQYTKLIKIIKLTRVKLF